MLCIYIKAFKHLENQEDLKQLCETIISTENLKAENKLLNQKYNEAISNVIQGKEREVDLQNNNVKANLEILQLKSKIQELENQLSFLEIFKT